MYSMLLWSATRNGQKINGGKKSAKVQIQTLKYNQSLENYWSGSLLTVYEDVSGGFTFWHSSVDEK